MREYRTMFDSHVGVLMFHRFVNCHRTARSVKWYACIKLHNLNNLHVSAFVLPLWFCKQCGNSGKREKWQNCHVRLSSRMRGSVRRETSSRAVKWNSEVVILIPQSRGRKHYPHTRQDTGSKSAVMGKRLTGSRAVPGGFATWQFLCQSRLCDVIPSHPSETLALFTGCTDHIAAS